MVCYTLANILEDDVVAIRLQKPVKALAVTEITLITRLERETAAIIDETARMEILMGPDGTKYLLLSGMINYLKRCNRQ